eukprot:CAMPEP_0202808908 /NCGR_PEP_ID=MMETSP1389-20130828/1333_1 /ASSEMBLY_ACC=CAM_ASM_000865 /TAXON_ID=302021 /ORGANISM="Rhodomonas sp., Strain CCMP768" /LENGTH=97 /DNA_ID=CAMNT_0049479353 /DNA_START=95 /DNA_END=388 /DNA_ORIENTATION=-
MVSAPETTTKKVPYKLRKTLSLPSSHSPTPSHPEVFNGFYGARVAIDPRENVALVPANSGTTVGLEEISRLAAKKSFQDLREESPFVVEASEIAMSE